MDVLSEDLISIIEDSNTSVKTKGVVDSITRLLDKCNLNGRQKRKNLAQFILSQNEFPNDVEIPEEPNSSRVQTFTTAFDKLLTQMQSAQYQYSDFARAISEEDIFKEVVSFMSQKLKTVDVNHCVDETFEMVKGLVDETVQEN